VSERIESGGTVWGEVCGPDKVDVDLLARELGLHALAVQSARHGRQRPKLEGHPTHVFLSAYAVSLDVKTGELEQ
jgi:magnesium transporter